MWCLLLIHIRMVVAMIIRIRVMHLKLDLRWDENKFLLPLLSPISPHFSHSSRFISFIYSHSKSTGDITLLSRWTKWENLNKFLCKFYRFSSKFFLFFFFFHSFDFNPHTKLKNTTKDAHNERRQKINFVTYCWCLLFTSNSSPYANCLLLSRQLMQNKSHAFRF